MEVLAQLATPQFWSALGAIVLIDLVLAGDNAIVIALAARSLPSHLQKRAIVWGTVGAVVVRSLMTLAVVWLLRVPGLLAVGGALLLWIAVKLLAPEEEGGHQVSAASTFWAAMRTIIVADGVMGVDNVLAVGGAAHGNMLLVVLGLAISIPIVVWGSSLLLRLVERFPVIMYVGAGVLGWTAGKMIWAEPLLRPWLPEAEAARWVFALALALAVVLAGRAMRGRAMRGRVAAPPATAALPSGSPRR